MSIFYRHDIIYESVTTGWYEILESDPGWDQAYNPPLVPARKVPPSSAAFVDEVEVISTGEPGWDQPAPPIVPPFPPITAPDPTPTFADAPVVAQDQPQFDIPPLVRRLEVFYGDLAFVDQVEPIDSGWVQAYLPPVVLARVNPASSSTFIELDEAVIVVAAKLELLGGGILQRRQMG